MLPSVCFNKTFIKNYVFTCHIALGFLGVAQGVVVLKHVEVEGHNVVAVEPLPNINVRYGPSACKNIVISAAHVDQLCKGLIKATLVAYY